VKPKLNKLALFRDLGYVPHAGQGAVHRSRARRRAVAAGVRWGKTVCAAMEGLAWALEPCEDSKGWVVAPTYELANRVFKHIVRVAHQRIPHRVISYKESERVLLIRNLAGGRSEVRAKSADNPMSLLGEGLDWLVIDEAAQLKSEIWTAYLSQRLIDREGSALLITTPKGKGWVYEFYRRGQGLDPDYESWNAPSWQNPMLPRADIEAERKRIPELTFRREYGGEFIEGGGSVFRNTRECATGEFEPPVADTRYYAGLDLARSEDYTVLVVVNQGAQVVHVDRFHRQDWSIQVNRVKAKADVYNHARILVDSTGVGEPVFESLRTAGCIVEGYRFTAQSKSDLITNLALMLETKQIVLPRPDLWPQGMDELEAYEYTATDAGGVRMEAHYGQHDDCVTALALAAWQVRKAPTVSSITIVSWEELERIANYA